MNQDALRSLDRLMDRMERKARRPSRRVSTAPVVLALGLIVGNVMLTRLVPMIWDSCLPHGLEQADTLRGWPGLVWGLTLFCRSNQQAVWVVIGGIVVISLLFNTLLRPLRFLVWLSALGVILADAGILAVTLRTSLSLTAAGLGF